MSGYLVVRGSGGMSNRLQAVAAAVPYALRTGRTLCVDWRDSLYADHGRNAFHRYFDLAGVPFVEELPDSRDIHPEFWRENLPLPVAVEYLFDNNHFGKAVFDATRIDLGRTDYSQEVVVFWSPDIAPLGRLLPQLDALPGFSGVSLEETARRVLTRHITPCAAVREAVDAFAARFRPPVVGVHVRHTDMESPVERMVAATRDVVGRTGAQVFLCTDNPHVQRLFARLFPGLLATEKFFPADGAPLHGLTEGVSSEMKGFEALLDMYLLGRCDHIIHYGRSSFARIAILSHGITPDRLTVVS